MLILTTFLSILIYISHVQCAVNENIQFLQFENFELNRQNFVDELKIVKVLQAYKKDLKSWHDYHKKHTDGLKSKKFDPHLPIGSSKLIERLMGYKAVLDKQQETINEVRIF